MAAHKFTIETDRLSEEKAFAFADRLTVCKDGSIRLYLDGHLVGAARSGFWKRVYVSALNPNMVKE